jgi:hypothetical protein
VDHHTTIHEVGEGGSQAVCSCGWRSPVFGADKAAGTMDPVQRAAEAGDLHEWEMSLPRRRHTPAMTARRPPARLFAPWQQDQQPGMGQALSRRYPRRRAASSR